MSVTTPNKLFAHTCPCHLAVQLGTWYKLGCKHGKSYDTLVQCLGLHGILPLPEQDPKVREMSTYPIPSLPLIMDTEALFLLYRPGY